MHTYLVSDSTGEVLDGELWEGHLWLLIQWIVAMVIVTLLEKSVVCGLSANESLDQIFTGCLRISGTQKMLTCGKQLWSSRILSIP